MNYCDRTPSHDQETAEIRVRLSMPSINVPVTGRRMGEKEKIFLGTV